MSEMEVSTGVDEIWISFFRAIVTQMYSEEGWSDDDIPRRAAEMADLMKAEIQKRGGIRRDSDLRETFAMVLDNLPAMIAGYEQLLTALKKSSRKFKQEDDG